MKLAQSITVAFVGDLSLGLDPQASLSSEVVAELRRAGLVIANQGGPITQ